MRLSKATIQSLLEEHVTFECGFCGKKGGAYVNHYDLVRCQCGKMFWALRPRRNGPLVMDVWPGNYQTEKAKRLMEAAA